MTGPEYNRTRWQHYGLVGSCIFARNNLRSVHAVATTSQGARRQALKCIEELEKLRLLLKEVTPFSKLKGPPNDQ
jgi:hypothetical protein